MGIKRKGAYAWQNIHHDPDGPEVGWHQNQSSPVIAMAAEKALLEGTPVEVAIIEHEDKMDFMLRTKVPRSSRLIAEKEVDGEVETLSLQNTCRYYISKDGDGQLIKIMPPLPKGKLGKEWKHPETGGIQFSKNKTEENRLKKGGYEFQKDIEIPPEERRIGINTGWNVRVCNDIKKFKGMSDIDYDYYIQEAEKLVAPLLQSI